MGSRSFLGCAFGGGLLVLAFVLLLNTMGGAFLAVLIGGMAAGAHDNKMNFTKTSATVEMVDRRCWTGKGDERKWEDLPQSNCDDVAMLNADWAKRRRGQVCYKEAGGSYCPALDTIRGAANVDVTYLGADGQRLVGKLRYLSADEPFHRLQTGESVEVWLCKKNPLRLKRSPIDQTWCDRPGAQGYYYQAMDERRN